MSESVYAGKVPQHFVCTHEQAREFINKEKDFYISICACRESRGGCKRSPMDVCLSFIPGFTTETEKRPATKQKALELVNLAGKVELITRPFRNADDPNVLDGICFCCPVCCHYFNHPESVCDKGTLRESTILEDCSACGLCVKSCYFGARAIVDGKLVVDDDKCYGCGLCVDACPAGCISMR